MARKRINPTLDEGVSGDEWEEYLADVRGHVRSHKNWQILAAEADVSPGTLSKLAYGETESPHARTLFKIMGALGRGKKFREAVRSQNPVPKAEAKKSRPPKFMRRKSWLLRQVEKEQEKNRGRR